MKIQYFKLIFHGAFYAPAGGPESRRFMKTPGEKAAFSPKMVCLLEQVEDGRGS
jgi:hypothetical protein